MRTAGADYLAARVECDRLGASAEATRFQVQLVSGNPEMKMLADAAFTAVGALSSSPDRNELRQRENHFEAAGTMFIHAASGRLRMTAPAYATDLRLCVPRRDSGPPPSAMRPWAPGSAAVQATDGSETGHGRSRKNHGRGRWERFR
jgi:hypothetical protein